MTTLTVANLLTHLAYEFPFSWAEPWDRVGLLAGDPAAVLRRVFVTLDPTPAALARAVDAGAGVLLTHHPAFLEGPTLMAGRGMSGVAYSAVTQGVALVAMHTNLDRSPAGADALPLALGLDAGKPLERSTQAMCVVATYAPELRATAVRRAAGEVGAGRIGMYEDCSFSVTGEGHFTPLPGANPSDGKIGVHSSIPEVRVEVVCSREDASRVVDAIRSAHPYDEPLVVASDARIARGAARMGRITAAPDGATLGSFAASVATSLGVRPTVWGDPDRKVGLIATAPGSGRSLVEDALTAGADVLVTGELRYHDALDAAASGLAVIEAGHDATEWPLVRVLAAAAARTEGIDAAAVIVDTFGANWWTTEGA